MLIKKKTVIQKHTKSIHKKYKSTLKLKLKKKKKYIKKKNKIKSKSKKKRKNNQGKKKSLNKLANKNQFGGIVIGKIPHAGHPVTSTKSVVFPDLVEVTEQQPHTVQRYQDDVDYTLNPLKLTEREKQKYIPLLKEERTFLQREYPNIMDVDIFSEAFKRLNFKKPPNQPSSSMRLRGGTNPNLTSDDKIDLKCYTYHWDTLINSYLLNDEIIPDFLKQRPFITTKYLMKSPWAPNNLNYWCLKRGYSSGFLSPEQLTSEIKRKVHDFDAIFRDRACKSSQNGLVFNKDSRNEICTNPYTGSYKFVSRGMTTKYPFDSTRLIGDSKYFIIKNYLSTTIDNYPPRNFLSSTRDAKIGTTSDNPSYIYIINITKSIPYGSFDSFSLDSYFPNEEEIIFPRECLIILDREDPVIDFKGHYKSSESIFVQVIYVSLYTPTTFIDGLLY